MEEEKGCNVLDGELNALSALDDSLVGLEGGGDPVPEEPGDLLGSPANEALRVEPEFRPIVSFQDNS